MSATTTQTSTSSTTTTTRLTASDPSPSTPPAKSPSKGQQEEEEEPEIYDEIEIEDMTYDATLRIYHYPCPCGDRFEISVDAMRDDGQDIAVCPGCSLMIRVVFEVGDLEAEGEKDDG